MKIARTMINPGLYKHSIHHSGVYFYDYVNMEKGIDSNIGTLRDVYKYYIKYLYENS